MRDGAGAVRQDVHLDNEATGWVITSACRNGRPTKDFERQGGAKWKAAMEDGSFIPIELVQDDSIDVRVIVGGDLTSEEAEEWVDRLEWHLSVPDGRLLLSGGPCAVDGEDDAPEYLAEIPVPPGDYHVDVYTYLTSPNGGLCLGKAGIRESGLKRFYGKTRAGTPMPLWLHQYLDIETEQDRARAAAIATIDAAAERSWRVGSVDGVVVPPREEPPANVDFVVHLTPLAARPVTEMPKQKGGWFRPPHAPRKPERFPMGLASSATAKRVEAPVAAQPMRVVPEKVFGLPLVAIAGGPVRLPLGPELALPYWVAMFCNRDVSAEFRVQGAHGFAPQVDADTSIRIEVRASGEFIARIDDWGLATIRPLHRLCRMLAELPDGATIDFAAAMRPEPEETADEPFAPTPGMHRWRGRVVDGSWTIDEGFPAVDAPTLERALQLAREIDESRPVTVTDAQTAEAVIARMAEDAFDYRYRLRNGQAVATADGPGIRLPCPCSFASFEVGAFTLRTLQPEAWTFVKLQDKPLWSFG